jgi:hypothetical protein
VCDYQLEADGLEDVTARVRELLGSHLIAGGAVPAAVEEGCRLEPPDTPWAPLQEQVRGLIGSCRLAEGCTAGIVVPYMLHSPSLTGCITTAIDPSDCKDGRC